jgi:hypothetical protein
MLASAKAKKKKKKRTGLRLLKREPLKAKIANQAIPVPESWVWGWWCVRNSQRKKAKNLSNGRIRALKSLHDTCRSGRGAAVFPYKEDYWYGVDNMASFLALHGACCKTNYSYANKRKFVSTCLCKHLSGEQGSISSDEGRFSVPRLITAYE